MGAESRPRSPQAPKEEKYLQDIKIREKCSTTVRHLAEGERGECEGEAGGEYKKEKERERKRYRWREGQREGERQPT